MSDDLWQRGCEQLAAELPEQQYNTWIRPLPPADVAVNGQSAVVSLRVPNRFKLDWIRSQYASRIEDVLTRLAGQPVSLQLHLALAPTKPAAVVAAPAGQLRTSDTPLRSATALPVHRLNSALTFDSLVAGRANQMARTAALHVAGSPGHMYNPLFIYGGVGLGKTHLVHAVGNALLKDNPNARVLYLHAEQFISDVVKNYQRKTFDELKAKYHSLDLLQIGRAHV